MVHRRQLMLPPPHHQTFIHQLLPVPTAVPGVVGQYQLGPELAATSPQQQAG
jgi:hypothetical protein